MNWSRLLGSTTIELCRSIEVVSIGRRIDRCCVEQSTDQSIDGSIDRIIEWFVASLSNAVDQRSLKSSMVPPSKTAIDDRCLRSSSVMWSKPSDTSTCTDQADPDAKDSVQMWWSCQNKNSVSILHGYGSLGSLYICMCVWRARPFVRTIDVFHCWIIRVLTNKR
jgi:hypothetical protein